MVSRSALRPLACNTILENVSDDLSATEYPVAMSRSVVNGTDFEMSVRAVRMEHEQDRETSAVFLSFLFRQVAHKGVNPIIHKGTVSAEGRRVEEKK